ncbi:MAG: T9SS type A sorting domain-containing protein [Saprospiraceae bacterium]|nr:T9SS type A sorting domain-containing protein [Saprospiraceae bacterium]MCB9305305.1 T9SS type A sorting domain-containing protein [Lewinellaceae bacterium]MCB9356051.1 T9SS type A sorting domain-containing protein [Lewinellaceae bacterium]
MKRNLLAILLIFPLVVKGQLKIEGIYPKHQYYSGQVSLLLAGDSSVSTTGYTSFQVLSSNGDTITKETGPSYFLPQNEVRTYTLELNEGVSNLPENLCGTLYLKFPHWSIDFCLNNTIQDGAGGTVDCNKIEITDIVYSGEHWDYMVSVILTSNDSTGTGVTGYTSMQLFNEEGDSLTYKTGPIHILPMFTTDTIVYNLKLINESLNDPINLESSCFELRLENPDCSINYCSIISNTLEADDTKFRIFPNPTSDELRIEGITPRAVEVLGSKGGTLISELNNTDRLDVSSLPNGVYIVRIYTDRKIFNKQLIKI